MNMDIKVIGYISKSQIETDEIFNNIERFRDKNDIFLQVFDAEYVIGEEHLIWAYDKAVKSFKNGTNTANSLEIETILWSSAETQIKDALEKMGLKYDSKKIAILTDTDPSDITDVMGWVKDKSVIKPSIEKLKRFGVTQTEIDSVEKPYDLVFEKMATANI